MCRITSPLALICGVTSSAMPEKNGVSVTSRLVLAAVPVIVLLLTSVTKNSSVPALITAFWLFSVATRGLESTRVWPCASSSSTNALKSPMSRRERERGAERGSQCAVRKRAAVRVEVARLALDVRAAPWLLEHVPPPVWPKVMEWPSGVAIAAQLMPAWNWSFSVTSTIFVSMMTCRTMLFCTCDR